MSNRTVILAAWMAIAIALAGAGTYARASSSTINDLTFNRPFSLPGVTLAAGTYRFEIVNPAMNRDIVRVTSADGRQIYYSGFTQRVVRPLKVPPRQIVTFGEAEEGRALPVDVWFPVGLTEGKQFRY